MKPSEIIEFIEIMAPLHLNVSWDNSGVQVVSGCQSVRQVAVMLDPSPTMLEKSIKAGANFIFCHHPLGLQAQYPNRLGSYFDMLSLLIKNDVWLYSAHSTLDSNPCGASRWLAKALGLRNLATLESTGFGSIACPTDGQTTQEFGFGFVGNLPSAMPYKEFCDLLASATGKRTWQTCGKVPAKVERIACCPGSGSSLAGLAAKAGAHLFITGDVKYHAAMETPVCMLDVGHFCLEEEMMRLAALELDEKLPIPVTFWAGADPLRLESV